MTAIKYRSADVDGLKIFYREAGAADAPALLLLHGFPSASHMFRDLIPLLADRFHIVAPDLPGFGQSDMPARSNFTYTFDHIAGVIDRFTEVIGLKRFAIYVFDYGAPTGFRIAAKHPDRITAIISQNGNAYEEGLSEGWNPIRAYWQEPSQANREALRAFLAPETTRWQYTHGVADETTVSPDGLSLDNFYLARPGADEIQLDLFGDYKSNIALYPAFQNYFRTHKPPFLAVWGKNDPFFLPPGAEAFRRDIPDAVVRFFDTGHFALETHAAEIAAAMREFLALHIWDQETSHVDISRDRHRREPGHRPLHRNPSRTGFFVDRACRARPSQSRKDGRRGEGGRRRTACHRYRPFRDIGGKKRGRSNALRIRPDRCSCSTSPARCRRSTFSR